MGNELDGKHLVWRRCNDGAFACAVCGIPVLPRAGAAALLKSGRPVALEAFAAVDSDGTSAGWICVVCSSARANWTFDPPDQSVAFHVTSPLNRVSIGLHGLDWRRMGDAPGIAGARSPEIEGVFLANAQDDAAFFATFKAPVDVWAISIDRLALETGPDGWLVSRSPIPAARMRLIHAGELGLHSPPSVRDRGQTQRTLTGAATAGVRDESLCEDQGGPRTSLRSNVISASAVGRRT